MSSMNQKVIYTGPSVPELNYGQEYTVVGYVPTGTSGKFYALLKEVEGTWDASYFEIA